MRPARAGRGTRVWVGACAAVAVALSAAAVGVALCWPSLFDYIVAQSMVLKPSARGYSEWRAPSLPIYFDVYLFNWTNPEEFGRGAPRVSQLGPYRYREIRTKTGIVWHANNQSVSYKTRREWRFEPSLSNGTLQDNVTTLDVVAAAAAYRARHWGAVWQMLLSATLGVGRAVWTRRTAAELMFAGYEDPLLQLTSMLPASLAANTPNFDRFGWFYKRNNSLDNDGHMTVSTGGGGGLAGQVLRWNHLETAPHLDPPCNRVNGSLGEFFPRVGARGAAHVTLFSPDLCRPLRLEAAGAGTVHDLPVLRFAVGARVLDNGTLFAENACWCGGECVMSGALNVSACRFGSPAFVSLPHFLHADPQYRRDVLGLAPDPARHSFFIDIEPTTGVPLDVAARFQLNILIAPYPNIGLFARAPRMLFPVLWVEQRVVVPANTAQELASARTAAAWGAPAAGVVALATFGVAAALAILLISRRHRRPTAASTPVVAELTTLVSSTA